MKNNWINLRQKYPEKENTYQIRNMYEDLEGTALYDGFHFNSINWMPKLKGPLVFPSLEITHWREDQKNLNKEKVLHECKNSEGFCYTDCIGNIILVTQREGELKRRTFCDYCPFCGVKAREEKK